MRAMNRTQPNRRASAPVAFVTLACTAALAMSACASQGPSGNQGTEAPAPAAPELPDVQGLWQGSVTVEGQTIDGTLDLTQDGADLGAAFSAPAFGLEAEGGGTVDAEGNVQIILDYNLECPGSAHLNGVLRADGTILSGTVEATDCTGQMLGAFDFQR
jgi:hypothetical protein